MSKMFIRISYKIMARTEIPLREETTESLAFRMSQLEQSVANHQHGYIGSGSQQSQIISGYLMSSNYKAGSSGWMIGAEDNCEFNSGTFRGTLSAAVGTLGEITAAKISLSSVGYIATALTGARCEMVYTASGGYTHGINVYDTAGTTIFRLMADGGYPPLTMWGTANLNCVQFLGHASGPADTVKITGSGLYNALYIQTDGSANRSAYAGLLIENYADKGYGLYIKNDADAIGSLIRLAANIQKGSNILEIEDTSWAATHEARITNENYIQFPAFYHCSDFDENISGNTALSSSVIAKAYWTGSGINGTQTLILGTNEDKNTYLLISTTATASSTSQILFGRAIGFDQPEIEFRMRFSNLTNCVYHFGFYVDATHYIYFKFDSAVHATNLYLDSNDGVNSASVNLNYELNTTAWHTFRLKLYPSNIAKVWIDDVEFSTGTQYIDINPKKPYVYADNKAVAEEKIIYLDYVKIWKGRDNTSDVS